MALIVEWEGRKYALIPTSRDYNIFRLKADGSLGREIWNGRASCQIYRCDGGFGLVGV